MLLIDIDPKEYSRPEHYIRHIGTQFFPLSLTYIP
jgi:hypothetical protein